MRHFSDDVALNREYQQYLSVIVALYFGFGLLLLILLGLIFRYECPSNTFTLLGWLEFIGWIA